MKINIETKHYMESTCYLDNDNCPLAEAIKDKYPESKICVGGFTATIDGITYKIGEEWSKLGLDQITQNTIDAKEGKHIPTIKVNLRLNYELTGELIRWLDAHEFKEGDLEDIEYISDKIDNYFENQYKVIEDADSFYLAIQYSNLRR